MRVTYNKLVRDGIPGIIEHNGHQPVTRHLDDDGFLEELFAKLVEEAGEVRVSSASDLPSELADVLEVLQAIVAAIGMSWDGLLTVAADKRAQRGGFSDRLFLQYVDQIV